jgi:hypothetical protein
VLLPVSAVTVSLAAVAVALSMAFPAADEVGHEPLPAAAVAAVHVVPAAHGRLTTCCCPIEQVKLTVI